MGKCHDLIRKSFFFFLINNNKGIWGVGTQKQLVMKNRVSINNTFLTVRPVGQLPKGHIIWHLCIKPGCLSKALSIGCKVNRKSCCMISDRGMEHLPGISSDSFIYGWCWWLLERDELEVPCLTGPGSHHVHSRGGLGLLCWKELPVLN